MCSDAFMQNDKSGRFEWTAHVININENRNLSLQKNCKPLYDYVRFVSRVNHNKDVLKMTPNEAVNEAVEWAIKENLLDGLIAYEKEEVMGTLLTEYNEEAIIKTLRDDGKAAGILEGKQQKAVETAKNLLKIKLGTVEQIAQAVCLSLEEVQKLQAELSASA